MGLGEEVWSAECGLRGMGGGGGVGAGLRSQVWGLGAQV
jgi:hypothetical protein